MLCGIGLRFGVASGVAMALSGTGAGAEAANHCRIWPLSVAPHSGHVTVDFIAHSADFNFIFILRYFDFAQ